MSIMFVALVFLYLSGYGACLGVAPRSPVLQPFEGEQRTDREEISVSLREGGSKNGEGNGGIEKVEWIKRDKEK